MSIQGKEKKISVIGAGYVGASIASVLSKNLQVSVCDIDKDKVDLINQNKSPIDGEGLAEFMNENKLKLSATTSLYDSVKDSDIAILALPTNFNDITNSFNTDILEKTINEILLINKRILIVIRSTVPIGFTQKQKLIYPESSIIFSPEFLREGSALEDSLAPSRIIIGGDCLVEECVDEFMHIIINASHKKEIEVFKMGSSEAEAVKLFSNSYLAMRVAFFNEVDSFSLSKNLDSSKIIKGISHDNRIGNFYNNPSFGYGGYCLPKDTKQLLSDFNDIPQSLISSIVESNEIRKKYIADFISMKTPKIVGVYRLQMKAGSSNFRNAAILEIIEALKEIKVNVIIYEPLINDEYFNKCKIETKIDKFKKESDLIIANRIDGVIEDVKEKVFSRDIFNKD